MSEDQLLNLIQDPTWDRPFFKILANNDTGSAPGHQGGIYIPIELRQYFPKLDEGLTSAVSPTVDRKLVAELFDSGRHLANCETRYQYQTWGGARKPESRVTDNLGPVRNLAHGGDLLILQRSRDRTEAFRFILIQQSSALFEAFQSRTQAARWGAFFTDDPPLNQDELLEAGDAMMQEAAEPFVAVRDEIPRTSFSRQGIARDTAFREKILDEYGSRCCVSGIGLATRTSVEAEAVHVIGLGFGGADEPRNGMLLSRILHWSFDQGLFGIDDNRCVIVPDNVQQMPENAWLIQFHGRKIQDAKTESLQTSPVAFAWHRENLLAHWEK